VDGQYYKKFRNGFKVKIRTMFKMGHSEESFKMWVLCFHSPTRRTVDLPDKIALKYLKEKTPLANLTYREAGYYVDFIAGLPKLEGDWSEGLIRAPRQSRPDAPPPRPDTMAGLMRDYLGDERLREEMRRNDAFFRGIAPDQTWGGSPMPIPRPEIQFAAPDIPVASPISWEEDHQRRVSELMRSQAREQERAYLAAIERGAPPSAMESIVYTPNLTEDDFTWLV
jgi:hypothetical protein